MAVILAVIGIVFLLVVKSNNTLGHMSSNARAEAYSDFKKRYSYSCVEYRHLSELRDLKGPERDAAVAKLKEIFETFPHGDRYIAKINDNTDLSNWFYCDILLALKGKMRTEMAEGDFYMPHKNPRNNAPIGGCADDEFTFDFMEARLDWIVAELARHGLRAPLCVWSDGEMVRGWGNKPTYPNKFYVPYKERPKERELGVLYKFQWNITNHPIIYPPRKYR